MTAVIKQESLLYDKNEDNLEKLKAKMKKSKAENCKSVIQRITTEMKDSEKRLVRFMKIEFQIG